MALFKVFLRVTRALFFLGDIAELTRIEDKLATKLVVEDRLATSHSQGLTKIIHQQMYEPGATPITCVPV